MTRANEIPKNILVIRTDRIGDVVLTTPALRALRQHFSKARISMLIVPSTLDLIQGNPDLDEILIDDRLGEHAGWKGFWKLVRDIRVKNFDLVINFHTKKRTNLLSFLAHIPRRVGFDNKKFGFFLTDKIKDVRPKGQRHEAQYCLDLLKVLGVSSSVLTTFIPVREDMELWAEKFFNELQAKNPSLKCVALHFGSSCPTKQWPVRYFADVVREIHKRRNVFFVVIGTHDQHDMLTDLQSQLQPSCRIHDLLGRTSLAGTVSILKRCDLLVSNDSGPVHIAAAFDTPVVSIFTRNQPGINPERWHPLGAHSRYAAPPLDLKSDFSKGQIESHEFLYQVTPQQVLHLVDALF